MSKKCPFCAELIHKDAIKCKHCGSYLVKSTIKKRVETVKIFGKNATSPWILFLIIISIISIWLWYLTIPTLIIWYIWKKTNLNINKKWMITGIIICIFLVISSIATYIKRVPDITITEPENNFSIQADNITIKGNVKPKYSKVTINNIAIAVEKGKFEYKVKLDNENNKFIFTAYNNKKTKEASIVINRVFTEEEKAQIEVKKQAAIDEANKKKQEEADQKETTMQNYAQRYCENRRDNYRKFPMFNLEDDGTITNPNDGTKGINLKTQDCRSIIDTIIKKMVNVEGTIDKDVLEKIIERKYWIGMDTFSLLNSLGFPNDINTTKLSGYESRQYVYSQDSYGINSIYIYITDDKVTSYQN
jgi:uncharacterized membrane protein YqjE